MNVQEQANELIGKIMEKSWADESFKKRLLEDATATLKAEGVAIPEGIKVNVVENTGNVLNFVLPANPAAELSDSDLEMVAGGTSNINLNIASLCAQRNLNVSQGSSSTTLQRLSSGLRINSASDDSSGLGSVHFTPGMSQGTRD